MNENSSLIRITCLKDICQKFKINYIEFESYRLDLESKDLLENESNQSPLNCGKQLIVSNRVAGHSDLVDLIEFRMGFSIFERDYDSMITQYQLNKAFICDADILIDEQTGIIFQDIGQFLNFGEQQFISLLTRISRFKFNLKFLYIFLIPSYQEVSKDFEEITSNPNYVKLAKFSMGNNQTEICFKLKQILISNFDNLEIYLKNIYSESEKRRKNAKYDWPMLSFKPTKDEMFLISLGCLNSFSAQYLLSRHKLTDIFEMKLEEFVIRFPLIETFNAKLFFDIINKP